jgi:chemotaxis protein MotB
LSDENNEQPIVVRKVKKGHGGHHGGAWKVAFADFMTAMMAFFLVMWLVGQSEDVKQAVAGYFRDPGKYTMQGKSGVLKGSDQAVQNKEVSKGLIDPPKEKETAGSTDEKEKLALVARNILEELEKQQAFQRLKKNVKIQMTSEGLRIILNESEDSPAFFEPGSAKLLQKSAIILVTIARELGDLSNHLVIEGHTDNSPVGYGEYTNWELSADRANSARQLMEVSGLYQGQVREIRGFANKFPMIANKPSDPRNRRVTLVVLYKERERLYDKIEVGEDLMGEIN